MRPLVRGNDAVGFQRIEAQAWILTTSNLKFGGGATPYAEIVARIGGVGRIVNIPAPYIYTTTFVPACYSGNGFDLSK
jgi:hypothetical protein